MATPHRLSLLKFRSFRFTPVAVGAIIAVLIIVGALLRQPIKNKLNTWKLLPQPVRLTELYFTHPNNLPSTYFSGQTQTVSFTIHNLEFKTEKYNYSIQILNSNLIPTDTLLTGSFTLKQGQYKNVTQNITLSDSGRVQVAVGLTYFHESIGYWLNPVGSSS